MEDLRKDRLTQIESALLPDSLELSDFKQKEGAAAMQSTATQYVGIDVQQATLVCVVKDEEGRFVCESKLATRREPIEQFLCGVGSRVHVAFEEGSQARRRPARLAETEIRRADECVGEPADEGSMGK